MTELEKALHEVLHYLSVAEKEAKKSVGADGFYQDAWMDISKCRTEIGKLLRTVEQREKPNE